MTGTIGELRSMAEVVSGPPAEHLRAIVTQLGEIEKSWADHPDSSRIPVSTRMQLERLKREIDRELYYSKVKTWIITTAASEKSSS